MWKTLIVTGGIVAATATVSSAATAALTTPDLPPRTVWMKTPCPEQFSTNCEWNGKLHQDTNDSARHSFYAWGGPLLDVDAERIAGLRCHFWVKPTLHSYCQIRQWRPAAR